MKKKTKRKLFALLMALTLIVTLMPTAAFAEVGNELVVGPGEEMQESVNKSFEVKMLDENGDEINPQYASAAKFKLTEISGTGPQSLEGGTEDDGLIGLRYDSENNKFYIDLEGLTIREYILSEVKEPTDYCLSYDEYKIEVKGCDDGTLNVTVKPITSRAEGGEITGVGEPLTEETPLTFYHEEMPKVTINVEKKVNSEAPEGETFTIELHVIEKGSAKEAHCYTESISVGNNEVKIAVDPKYTQPKDSGSGYDGTVEYAYRFILNERDDNKTGWTYSDKMYELAYVGDGLFQYYEVTKNPSLDSGYERVTESPIEDAIATFTNTYTKSYSGGGSTTRYYNVKVNNGKALSITGAELSRVVAGTTINAVADPAAEGKVFKGWEVVKGGITVGEADTFSFAMPHEDVELTAVYEDKKEPVTPADPGDSEDPAEPDDVEEQPEDYDGPVPKTGDTQAAELAFFAALLLMAAFGLKKVYNR